MAEENDTQTLYTLNKMEPTTTQPKGSPASACSHLRPLAKGDTVQRGDVFVDDGQRFEMSRSGVLFGCYCLGKTIIKDNGGWYRPSLNAKEQTPT